MMKRNSIFFIIGFFCFCKIFRLVSRGILIFRLTRNIFALGFVIIVTFGFRADHNC